MSRSCLALSPSLSKVWVRSAASTDAAKSSPPCFQSAWYGFMRLRIDVPSHTSAISSAPVSTAGCGSPPHAASRAGTEPAIPTPSAPRPARCRKRRRSKRRPGSAPRDTRTIGRVRTYLVRTSDLDHLVVQPRHIARVALFLALTIVGCITARVLAERDVRRESDRRAEVAAVQIHGRITQAASLTESLRRFMLDPRSTGVTSPQFARNALRWLGPARFPAAAWVEQVPAAQRAAYERRIGQPIVRPDARYGVAPLGPRSSYVPATLVTGFPPMAVPGIDLSRAPGLAAALGRASRRNGVVATPIAPGSTTTSGLFLAVPAPNLSGQTLRPGYVVVFVADRGLRAAATGVRAVQVRTDGTQAPVRGESSSTSFTAAGQRFTVSVPREPVEGAAAVLPWVILAGGLLVVALVAALGLNAARRARAQEDFDRIFMLSQDLIAVADFHGRFTRVNPAAEEILGYTEEELLSRPYGDLVHPDDRGITAAETDALTREGRRCRSRIDTSARTARSGCSIGR